MPDYFEIDFLDVETAKSGDAICMRYQIGDQTYIQVVDGGFEAVGERIIEKMNAYYGFWDRIDHVVVTHPDGDHACGLRTVLRECSVGTLWMLRPWVYADQLLRFFPTYNSVQRLASRLRQVYPHIAELEDIAFERGITINEPFQGRQIGAFTVLAPSPARYGRLIIDSEKTPEGVQLAAAGGLLEAARDVGARLWNLVKGAWGHEVFSPNETSAENEMSIVQYANIAGKRIVLTGDAGRAALREAADFAPSAGLLLPGVDFFQVPHHGSRRNVDGELLDRWLGPRLSAAVPAGQERFRAVCSSAHADEAHPRKSVERAFCHRGAKFITTEDGDKVIWHNAPGRADYSSVPARPYPQDYEE